MPDPSPHSAATDRSHRGWDQPEPQPLPDMDAASEAHWGHFVKGLSADFEFLLLAGALLALSGWFILESGRERPHSEPAAFALAGPAIPPIQPAPAFAFVRAEGRDQLLPALQAVIGRSSGTLPKPVTTASVEQHALVAEPLFDPLGSLQISGLPSDARLSAGASLVGHGLAEGGTEAGAWAVAFGDLDNLVIELPRQRAEPVRATLDLRTRAGVKIASLTVEVREAQDDGATTAPVTEPITTKAKVRPAKAVRPGSKNLRKTARPPATTTAAKPPPVFPGDAPKAIKPQKPSVAAPGAAATGFFQPDPKDSEINGLSAASREDPRFMTLRGLGMPPSELGPPPGPPPPL